MCIRIFYYSLKYVAIIFRKYKQSIVVTNKITYHSAHDVQQDVIYC